MNIAIIDDVQQDLDALAEAAREHYDQKQISIQLHTFSSPEDFWNSYSPGSYDLIFLDIYIKQANGMDLAAQLREKGDSCALIFVTSSDAFAVASYDVQAAYYLLKPLDTNKLTKGIGLHSDQACTGYTIYRGDLRPYPSTCSCKNHFVCRHLSQCCPASHRRRSSAHIPDFPEIRGTDSRSPLFSLLLPRLSCEYGPHLQNTGGGLSSGQPGNRPDP